MSFLCFFLQRYYFCIVAYAIIHEQKEISTKYNIMKRLIVILMLSGFITGIQAQRVLSLDSCRNLAIANNKTLQISKLKMEKAHYEDKAAFTNYLPKISASGGYMRFGDEISLLSDAQKNNLGNLGTNIGQALMPGLTEFVTQLGQINPILGQMAQQFIQSGKLQGVEQALNQAGKDLADAFRTDTRNTWVAGVMLTQPLYMGGKIRAYNKITELSKELAGKQYDTETQNLVLSTDEAYWMTVSLSNKKKLAEGYLNLIRKLDEDVEKMIQEGVATQADGLTVKVKLNEAEMNLTKVDNGLSLSKMLLCQLCGLDLTEEITLADESVENVLAETVSEEELNQGADQRPEIQSLEIANQIYQQKINVVRSDMLPSLALIGGYAATSPSVFNSFEKKFRGTWNVGVMLQVPILHWGEGFYKVKAAKAEATIAKMQKEEIKEKIELQISQSKFKTEEAQKRLALANRSMEKAEENLKIATKGFREGVIPTSNVMEAQTAWLSAQTEKIDAQIDIRLADTYLKKALGRLQVQ